MNFSRFDVIKALFLATVAYGVLFGCDAPSDSTSSSNVSGSEDMTKQVAISHPPEGYSISASSQLDDNKVLLELATNIPGTIEIMAGISLSNQDPDDVWIGKNKRVRLENGTGQVTFDVSDLPSGQYEVEATFYPRWGFQDEASKLSGIDENIEYTYPITLKGSGEPAEVAAQRNEDQKWVMENIIVGSEWEREFWMSRFGQWEEFPVTTRNPDIISNYYFESLDMTIIVNTLKDEVVTWRMGQDGL
jgi:hypothetical protein